MTEQHKQQQQYTPSYSTPTNRSIRVLLPTVETKQKKSSLNDNNSSSSNNIIGIDKKQQNNKNINNRRRQRSDSHTDSDNSSQGSSSTTSSKKESRSSGTKKAPPKKQKQPHHNTNNKQHPHSSKNGYNNNKHYNKKNNKHWQSQYVAMDCEMVGIGTDGIESALARVTIVNYDGYIIYDQYVKPNQPVTDYRTFVSGITPEQLSNESGAIPYLQCRQQVQNILKNKILIGHGLNNDLSVLNLYHPWEYIRDTALYEPFMKIRNYYYNPYYDNTNNDTSLLCPRKLKDLSKDLLKWDIQCANKPHSPIEDAVAALQLYKLVKYQWEKFIQYKIHKSNNILQHKQQHNNVKVVNNNKIQQQQKQQNVETTAKAIASAA